MDVKHDDRDPEDPKRDATFIATASIDEIHAEARLATQYEKELTFREALRLYPKAVGWSLFFCLGIIMYVRPQSWMPPAPE